ncbi:MAG: gamma-glutamyltranspeptidase / glutathione hydrolase [Pseudonocardiales bacterium]|nr:gamma-glutamyltranspeptidase / glutathione hydrolase [Pseudonocardiales bacterium]
MVASTHWLASSTGMSVLERGGNAFDAAVAAGFVLQIVEPHLNGPGGDSSVVVWSAADNAPHVVCGQGPSPAGASIEHFRSLGLDLVPGSGLLAATVPGAFGAWLTMLERWGTWELADVLAPAIDYAERGYPVLPSMARTIEAVRELFVGHWTTSAATWLAHGRTPRPGARWRSPVIAQTYRRLLGEASAGTREQRIAAARRAWYDGFVADDIGAFSSTSWRDTSGRDHAGVLTAADLSGWVPPVEAPASVDFGARYQILKTGPWGQGPVLLQQLRLLEARGVHDLPVRSAEWIHAVVEAAKLAFADREAYYGDPPEGDVPLDALLSMDYAADRAERIGATASLQFVPGTVDGRAPLLPSEAGAEPADTLTASTAGEPTVGRYGENRGDTCHVDVVDRWGNFVSATPSGGWLQSSPVIPSLGFGLGTRAQMFYLQPGLPNSLRPGRRPRTTLSPSLALRDGQPWLAFGTPGGDQQDQWQLTFVLDVVAAERAGALNLQDAIDAPALHTRHFPSSFYPRTAHPGEIVVESRLDEAVLADLESRGHRITRSGPWSLGRLSAVSRGEDGVLRAAANARGAQGYAVGR